MEGEERKSSLAASGHVNVNQGLSSQDDADMLGQSFHVRNRKQLC
jgi:hypothetical protein